LKNNKVAVVEAAGAAGQTALTSDISDCKDFDAVTFLVLLGDVSTGSVLTLTVESGALANGSDMAATASVATYTASTSDADSKILACELFQPDKRYTRAVLTRTTADAVVGGIVAIQSHPRFGPISQDATVISEDFQIGV
jgi:hypothetical protein